MWLLSERALMLLTRRILAGAVGLEPTTSRLFSRRRPTPMRLRRDLRLPVDCRAEASVGRSGVRPRHLARIRGHDRPCCRPWPPPAAARCREAGPHRRSRALGHRPVRSPPSAADRRQLSWEDKPRRSALMRIQRGFLPAAYRDAPPGSERITGRRAAGPGDYWRAFAWPTGPGSW
jgi:hypothetical protein